MGSLQEENRISLGQSILTDGRLSHLVVSGRTPDIYRGSYSGRDSKEVSYAGVRVPPRSWATLEARYDGLGSYTYQDIETREILQGEDEWIPEEEAQAIEAGIAQVPSKMKAADRLAKTLGNQQTGHEMVSDVLVRPGNIKWFEQTLNEVQAGVSDEPFSEMVSDARPRRGTVSRLEQTLQGRAADRESFYKDVPPAGSGRGGRPH